MSNSFNPGEVYDLLCDDTRHKARATQVQEMAQAFADLCELAVDDMAESALEEGDEGFAAEVAEHEAAFVEKLAKTAAHEAVRLWKERRAAEKAAMEAHAE